MLNCGQDCWRTGCGKKRHAEAGYNHEEPTYSNIGMVQKAQGKKASSLCHLLFKTSRGKDTTNVSEVPLEKVACVSISDLTRSVLEGSMDMLICPLNNSFAHLGKLLPD